MTAGRAYRPHRAGRPRWRCIACGALYPSSPARLSLLIEYAGNRVALAIYLASMLQDALDDAYQRGHRPDPRAMHDRFLGWLTRPRVSQPRNGRQA